MLVGARFLSEFVRVPCVSVGGVGESLRIRKNVFHEREIRGISGILKNNKLGEVYCSWLRRKLYACDSS